MSVGQATGQSPTIYSQGLFSEQEAAAYPVGMRRCLDDGRVFKYAKMGAVAGVAGNLYQAPVQIAHAVNIAVQAAVAVGDQTINVTLGATAVVADQYAEGMLTINDAAGEGHQYKIRSHPAHAGTGTLVVLLYDKVRVALTTSSEATLSTNQYKSLIIQPSPNTAMATGVCPMVITALYYFWLQTAGACTVLTDGTIVAGQHVRSSDAVDGAVEALVRAGAAEDEQTIGRVITVSADTEYSVIDLVL